MKDQRKKAGRIPSKRIGRLAWLGIIVAVFALGATAAVSLRTGDAKNAQARLSKNETDSPARVGFHSAARETSIGLQTGQIRPLTQEEAQKLAEGIKKLVNQSTDGLESVRHADGSVELALDGRFQNIAIARRNADGTLSESCVDNPKAAADFFGIDPQLVGVPADTSSLKKDIPQPERGVER
ncbi:MAG TPA: hypothetical protein VMZ30_09345 [Pyrinomonadaceae bacterium]|nr:hypothetical protein [Pyrinomonadaceae bacterium]